MSSYELVKYRPFPADPLLNLYLQEATTVPFPNERISYSASVMHLFDYNFDNAFRYDLYENILDPLGSVKLSFFRKIPDLFPRRGSFDKMQERLLDVLYALTRCMSAHRSKSTLNVKIDYELDPSDTLTTLMHNAIVFFFAERQTTLKELEITSRNTKHNIPNARSIFIDMILLLSNQLERLTLPTSIHACGIADSISSCTKLKQLHVHMFPLAKTLGENTVLILPKSLKQLTLVINETYMPPKKIETYFRNLHIIDEIVLIAGNNTSIADVMPLIIEVLRSKARTLIIKE